MIRLIFVCVLVLFAWHEAHALTIPSGHVLSSDGKVYECVSPDQEKNIIATGKEVGIHGNSVYVVVSDMMICVPLIDLMGKDKETQIEIITDVVRDRLLAEKAQGEVSKEEAARAAEEAEDAIEAMVSKGSVEEVVAEVEKEIVNITRYLHNGEIIEKITYSDGTCSGGFPQYDAGNGTLVGGSGC